MYSVLLSKFKGKYVPNMNGFGEWLDSTKVIVLSKIDFYSFIVFHCCTQPTKKPVQLGTQPPKFNE